MRCDGPSLGNSPWASNYADLWQTRVSFGLGSFVLAKPLLLWINDGLMAVFFFVVGLEIKREVLIGELSTVRHAALPIAAALGGMIVPRSNPKKLVVWAGVLIFVFLFGFIPSCISARNAQERNTHLSTS